VPVAATDRVAVSRAVLLRCSERVGVAVRVGTRHNERCDSDRLHDKDDVVEGVVDERGVVEGVRLFEENDSVTLGVAE
jgi:hypothetical protein